MLTQLGKFAGRKYSLGGHPSKSGRMHKHQVEHIARVVILRVGTETVRQHKVDESGSEPTGL